MIQHFDVLTECPISDVQLVEQIGYIDLRSAYETGIVEGSLDGTESSSNGIDDPSSIIGRPDDVFAMKRASGMYDSAVTGSAPSNGSPSSESGAPSESSE